MNSPNAEYPSSSQTLRETVVELHKENTEDKPPSLSDGDSEYNEGKALERGDSDDGHSNE